MITFSNWKSRPPHCANCAVQKQYTAFPFWLSYPGSSQCKLAPGVYGFCGAPQCGDPAGKAKFSCSTFWENFVILVRYLEKEYLSIDSLTKETKIYIILFYFSEIKKKTSLLAPPHPASGVSYPLTPSPSPSWRHRSYICPTKNLFQKHCTF